MTEPTIEQRLDEIEVDLTATFTKAVNAHWTSTALACALIDRGVIEKNDLLKILDSLILTASSYAVTAEANPDAACANLERMRRDLEQLELRPGHVHAELAGLEQLSAREARRYQEILDRSRLADEGS